MITLLEPGVVGELPVEPAGENMGLVRTTIQFTNLKDRLDALEGTLPEDQVRSVTLDNVMVDTGATMLALPADVIRELGLRFVRTVRLRTANSLIRAQVFGPVQVSVAGREGPFDCVEIPIGSTPLLGVYAMEVLGLEPDLRNQRLKVLSDSDENTYVLAL